MRSANDPKALSAAARRARGPGIARLLLALCVASVCITQAGHVAAQGFFESLFGIGKPKPPPAPRAYQPPPDWRPSYGYRDHRSFSPYRRYDRGIFDDYEFRPRQSYEGRRYRTMCVRMCDGYYFPISFSTSRQNFHRDAADCNSRCGSEARLFYYSNPGEEPEDMVDLTGRAYASMPIAFRHRKELVEGCRCRPQPWSTEERARHAAYAEPPETDKTAARPGEGDAPSSVVAAVKGGTPTTQAAQSARAELTAEPVPAVVRPDAAERPQPVATSRPRSRQHARQAPIGRPTKPAPTSGSSGWGWSNQKYTWPGDR